MWAQALERVALECRRCRSCCYLSLCLVCDQVLGALEELVVCYSAAPLSILKPTHPSTTFSYVLQEAFEKLVVDHDGFEYRPERPKETTFVGQKWGWTGKRPGARERGGRGGSEPGQQAGSPLGYRGGSPTMTLYSTKHPTVLMPRPSHSIPHHFTSNTTGDWAELEFDSRADAAGGAGGEGEATVYLSHLKVRPRCFSFSFYFCFFLLLC